jgi:hypothetical protein
MKHHKLILAAAAVALAVPMMTPANAAKGGGAGGGSGGATGGTSVTSQFAVPVHLTGWVTDASWCDNKGPHIYINTGALYGGFSTELTFMNNLNDKSTLEVVGAQSLTVLGEGEGWTEAAWKQPSRGGAGGNPFIYIDPDDTDGTLSDAIYIGRCVQDGKIGQLNHGHWSVDTSTLATSVLSAQALECSNKGSSLTIGTDTNADAVTGRLVFSNSDLGLNPQHISPTEVTAAWGFNNGLPLSVRKGGGATGAGGNPLVTSEYGTTQHDADGNEVLIDGKPVFTGFSPSTKQDLGRCNKI